MFFLLQWRRWRLEICFFFPVPILDAVFFFMSSPTLSTMYMFEFGFFFPLIYLVNIKHFFDTIEIWPRHCLFAQFFEQKILLSNLISRDLPLLELVFVFSIFLTSTPFFLKTRKELWSKSGYINVVSTYVTKILPTESGLKIKI